MDIQHHRKFLNSSSLLEFLLSNFFHKSHVHSLSVLFFICFLSPQQIWDLHYSPPLLPSFLFSPCLCFNEVLLLRDLIASVGLQYEVFSDLLLKVSTQCILFWKSGVFWNTMTLKLAARHHYKLFDLVRVVCMIEQSYKMQNSTSDEVEWVSLRSYLNFL